MALEKESLEHLSDSQIVQRCSDPDRQILGEFQNIVKLSEVVLKFGWNVSAEEADNQEKLSSSSTLVSFAFQNYNAFHSKR